MRRRFEATDDGGAHLERKREHVEALMARLASVGENCGQAHGAPVHRAMVNLKMALQHRLAQGELSEDMMHDVAALIDEVARTVERLR